MAYQGIGTGTLPNDNTGDNLRDAGIKINDNFSEIYNHFGDGTNLTAIVGTGIATESGIVGTGVTLIEFKGSAVGEVVVESGIATITVSDFQESLYGDSDVDTHLNVSFAGANEVLSWNGSDYDWVSNAGYTNSNEDTHLNRDGTVGVNSVLSWDGSDYAWIEQSTGGGGATDLNGLTDVTITTPSSGQVLKYNGSNWVNDTDATGGGGGSGDYSEVAGIATYTSEWTLGANGINHYTFTGPGLTGAENDPALYLTRGQQYKFYNNSGGHPFRIQSTPNGSTGTQYNDGIPTNDVGAGSTLTWDVQFDAPNKLYYQCTQHPNMGGPIYIIPRTEPAVGVRTEVSGTTGSVGAGATANLDIDGFKSYGLLKVGISSAAWVRLYVDAASRTSDASRSYLTDPSPGSGLIAEVRTETAGISTFLMTPGVIGWNNEVSIGSSIYAAVTNNESSSATITVDLTVVKMED